MVIASALPFPHDPTSRSVAATTTALHGNRNNNNVNNNNDNDFLDQSAATTITSLPDHASSDYNSHDTTPTDYKYADYNMADRELQNQKEYIESYSNEVDNKGILDTSKNLDDTLDVPPMESLSREVQNVENDKNMLDFSTKNGIQDFTVTTTSPDSQTDSSDLTGQRTKETKGVENLDTNLGFDSFFEGGDMFLDAHPRVLFSSSPPQHPPLQLMLENSLLDEEQEWDNHIEGHGDRANFEKHKRDKRSNSFDGRWVQRSVCESENVWANKTTATDSKGIQVSIVQEIQTQTGRIKQYFYETRCRQAEYPPGGKYLETGVAGASCLGIDKKQWKSKCIAKQSYVRALTKNADNLIGWRWIRIDSSCVCVLLSRTNKTLPREVLMGRGRG